MYKVDQQTGLRYFDQTKVYLVAKTVATEEIQEFFDDFRLSLVGRDDRDQPTFLPELSGRICYMSFGEKAKSRTNREYLENILQQKHYSVLRPLSYTVIVRGCSRGFTHEQVRHHFLGISQHSTRYCDEHCFVLPVHIRGNIVATRVALDAYKKAWDAYEWFYNQQVREISERHPEMSRVALRKAARGTARSFLPIGLEAPIVLSGNVEAWREVFRKRIHEAADIEIRGIARKIKKKIQEEVPNCFQDMEDL